MSGKSANPKGYGPLRRIWVAVRRFLRAFGLRRPTDYIAFIASVLGIAALCTPWVHHLLLGLSNWVLSLQF